MEKAAFFCYDLQRFQRKAAGSSAPLVRPCERLTPAQKSSHYVPSIFCIAGFGAFTAAGLEVAVDPAALHCSLVGLIVTIASFMN